MKPEQIAQQLSQEQAQLPDGVQLPGEHQLAARFGVTRAAVRSALSILESRHLIRRVRGAGTFTNRPVDHLISAALPPSLSAGITAAGGTVKSILKDVTVVTAGPELAEALECDPGASLTRVRRRSWINDRIGACAHIWIAPEVLAEAELALRTVESLYESLRMAGHQPVRARSRVSHVFPADEVEQMLELPQPELVPMIETLSRDAQTQRPLLFSRGWHRPDVIRLTVEW